MKNLTKEKLYTFFTYCLLCFLGLIIVGFIGLSIYCWIAYGNLPPEEVPSWVHWLMWRR